MEIIIISIAVVICLLLIAALARNPKAAKPAQYQETKPTSQPTKHKFTGGCFDPSEDGPFGPESCAHWDGKLEVDGRIFCVHYKRFVVPCSQCPHYKDPMEELKNLIVEMENN